MAEISIAARATQGPSQGDPRSQTVPEVSGGSTVPPVATASTESGQAPPQSEVVQPPAATGESEEILKKALELRFNKAQMQAICKEAGITVGEIKSVVADMLLRDVAPAELCLKISKLCAESADKKFPSGPFYFMGGGLHIIPNTSGLLRAPQASRPPQTPFSLDEYARWFHAMSRPTVFAALVAAKQHKSRDELEEEQVNPFTLVAEVFNDLTWEPDAPAPLPAQLSIVDGGERPYERTPDFLRTKWADVRRVWSNAHILYTASGQNVVALGAYLHLYKTFIADDVSVLFKMAVLYAWSLFSCSPTFLQFSIRSLAPADAHEGGYRGSLSSGAGGTPAPSPQRTRGRKRGAQEELFENFDKRMDTMAPPPRSVAPDQAEELEALARASKAVEALDQTSVRTRLMSKMADRQAEDMAAARNVTIDLTE